MKLRVLAFTAVFAASCVYSWTAAADDDRASAATIAARQRFFGAENVDPHTGQVRRDRVIFSWITNAGYAASFRGRVVLLDTYINRFEVPPTSGPDLRRTSFGAKDLIDLNPEAIFLGHGHGDHADNAAYVAKWLNIPDLPQHRRRGDVMQEDVARMAADPNTVNGGAKLVPNANPVNCIGVVPGGSVPVTSVLNLKQLDPVACVVAFKHIHSSVSSDRSEILGQQSDCACDQRLRSSRSSDLSAGHMRCAVQSADDEGAGRNGGGHRTWRYRRSLDHGCQGTARLPRHRSRALDAITRSDESHDHRLRRCGGAVQHFLSDHFARRQSLHHGVAQHRGPIDRGCWNRSGTYERGAGKSIQCRRESDGQSAGGRTPV